MSPPLAGLVSFIESQPEPHLLCDSNYRVLAANAAYKKLVGEERFASEQTCFAMSHRLSVPCDQAGETCPLKQSLRSRQRERVLHLHHTPDGEAYVNIELSPIADRHGRIVYFIERIVPTSVAHGLQHAEGLVGQSPAFRHMLEMVARVAPSDAAVLLLGESGTGKELVARAIHDASSRSGAAFVVVDCSGLPEALFESELFGHEKGAFTGAVVRTTGLVDAANDGTLFLDEVGDIPLLIQVKLLRLLETGMYRRVGSAEPRRTNIRLISATHRNLREMVKQGTFRQDLYFRLNTFPVDLPALRERRTDIPLLTGSLLTRVAGNRKLGLSENATELLISYSYPGNIRELRNILERASLLCDGETIEPWHLPEEVRAASGDGGNSGEFAPASLKTLELRTLRARLAEHGGSRKSLAKELGISERTLYRRLKQL